MPAATFAPRLAELVATAPGRPLLTWYDESTGERVELSRTTTANWVAKVAGLLQDEVGLERGQRLRVDLPPHWLTPVFWSAAWSVGLVVDAAVGPDGPPDTDDPDAVVCGPARLAHWAPRASSVPVLACALLPLGRRFTEPVPRGVVDVGADVWSQPDAFTAYDPPAAGDPALDLGDRVLRQDELWAAPTGLLGDGGRLLAVADPASPPEPATWLEPLARGGSLVLVAHADPQRLEAIAVAEHVTDRFPRGDQQPDPTGDPAGRQPRRS